jgi:HSP20 family molecular chaperone IbpA
VHYSERSRATLKRMVRLPITADADNVTAKLDHGLLCINIMKKESEVEEPVTRVIDVEES